MRAIALGVFVMVAAGATIAQKAPTDADRAAALVVRWQKIVYPKFEGARASIAEEESDSVNALLSGAAVRSVRDHLDPNGLQKADAAVDRFAAAMIKAGSRQPNGSLILEAESYEKALDAVCPLYPLCDR